jgi:NADH:ubiquinone oxidoreductase subunit 6 (subunit J)
VRYIIVTALVLGALVTLPLLIAALIVVGEPLLGVTGWEWRDFLFALFGVILLVAGIAVVTMRDIIRCGLAMIVCFAALAGLYVLLGAPLVAASQVLVYIGAISVLVLFAIMLTQTKAAPTRLVFQSQAPFAAIAAFLLAIIIGVVVVGTAWGDVTTVLHTATDTLAGVLFSDYLLPFEVVSVLLLVAVVGGVYLAKRDEESGG